MSTSATRAKEREISKAEPTTGYLRVNASVIVSLNSFDQSLLICGRATEALDLLAEESVQTVVTSPPYWSLRDYEVEDQIGRDDPLFAPDGPTIDCSFGEHHVAARIALDRSDSKITVKQILLTACTKHVELC